MRILITGINGFVGRHLAEHLSASGRHQVIGLTRKTAGAPLADVSLVHADLLDPAQTRSALADAAPDTIFHLAAQANVPQSFADPAGTLQTNMQSQLNLFEAVRALGADPLVLVAVSNEIYGPPSTLPVDEDAPLRPVNPYAVSKATQDLLAYQYFAAYHMRTIRLRPFNHIGPRQSDKYVTGAFAAQIARIEAGLQEPLMRVGNLSAERDFTDVRDIVRAYELAALHGEAGAAYNIGSDRAVSIQHILDRFLAHSRVSIRVEPDPARMRPTDVPRVVCDSRRFRSLTGWEPQIPLEQTLIDILDVWREVRQENL